MYYFGTDLSSAGHYFWKAIDDDLIYTREVYFNTLPFDPETILEKSREKGQSYQKGECKYFQVGPWSIIAIEGSCTDNRMGTKSVFFVKEDLNKQELELRIKAIPVARQILAQMPFTVQW